MTPVIRVALDPRVAGFVQWRMLDLDHTPSEAGVDIWLVEQIWRDLPRPSTTTPTTSQWRYLDLPLHRAFIQTLLAEMRYQIDSFDVYTTAERSAVRNFIREVGRRTEVALVGGSHFYVDEVFLQEVEDERTLLEVAVEYMQQVEPDVWWRRILGSPEQMNAYFTRVLRGLGYDV